MARTGKYDKLLHNYQKLKNISKLKTVKGKNKYICNANNYFISCLVECASNVLCGNVPLSQREKQKLSKHLTFLRNIGKERKTDRARKKLGQAGGFVHVLVVPILAALATTAVSEIITKLVTK